MTSAQTTGTETGIEQSLINRAASAAKFSHIFRLTDEGTDGNKEGSVIRSQYHRGEDYPPWILSTS
ncbi:hypothetical protein BBB56_13070 [Candidatus Pantoea deserta]|uniref:Uncharacterized protein n=1 Tax=Candidatus Pantoea deserta TaxID=1869313 RepID=A0A3N4NVG6_9GAMM|nr:hypothetical protein BBB56_13070 [Pantoea deserta]